MIKWLLKNTAEFRLETMSDVEDFHKQLQKKCEYESYTLTSFSWTEKTVKAGGDEMEVYYVVKYTYVFNTAKDPEFPYDEVDFHKLEMTNLTNDFEPESNPADEIEEDIF